MDLEEQGAGKEAGEEARSREVSAPRIQRKNLADKLQHFEAESKRLAND